MAFFIITQIKLVDDIDHLTKEHAVLHIGVGIFKGRLDDGLLDGRRGIDLDTFDENISVGILIILAFQYGEKNIVDKTQKRIASHAFSALFVRPITPAAGIGDD